VCKSVLYPILDCFISEIDSQFSRDCSVILCGIVALCPGGQTFLSEEHLKEFAAACSVSENDLKHEIPLANKLLMKEHEQDRPATFVQFLSFICPYKAAFDCLYKLLLIAVTLPVTSVSCERRSFSKMKLIKTFLRKSLTSDRLSNMALLSTESSRTQ